MAIFAAAGGVTFQTTLPVWGATQAMSENASEARFQSTLPVWGATLPQIGYGRCKPISIHAPRVGSDSGNSQ